MSTKSLIALSFLGITECLSVAHASYSYTTFDFSGGVYGTIARDINNSGLVVGNDGGTTHIFTYSGGSFQNITDPVGVTPAFGINGTGINDSGQIVGHYNDSAGTHGFLYSEGSYTLINHPLSLDGNVYDTFATDINNNNLVSGYYIEQTYPNHVHSFLYNGSSYTGIDFPNPIGSIYNGTYALGLNNSGQVAGYYNDNAGNHGFVFDGTNYLTLDAPDASPGYTFATGINDSGQISGYYQRGSYTYGFIYSDGNYTTLDLLGVGVYPSGINNSGQVAGYYADGTANGLHGFVASPSVVPIPATIWLFGSALAGFGVFGKRRFSRTLA